MKSENLKKKKKASKVVLPLLGIQFTLFVHNDVLIVVV